MEKLKVCIVGHGFVGKAVDYGFNDHTCEKTIIDPIYDENKSIETTSPLEADITFICVPTPMADDGTVNTSIVEDSVNKLMTRRSGIIVIKSTVTPDVIKRLSTHQIGKNRVCYNPEFLTEKNAVEDFVNPPMHIFGGSPTVTKNVEEIYKQHSLCKPCPIFHMEASDASFVKYGINSFLATKVLFFNQFYDVVEKFGGNFGRIINAIGEDPRIGQSHTRVPGHDGRRGFGGACFPKDTSAFIHFSDHNFSLLEKAVEENNKYRKDYEKCDREKAQNVSYE